MIRINAEKAAQIVKGQRKTAIHQTLNKIQQTKKEAERENNLTLISDLSAQEQDLIDELRELL